MGNFVDSSLQVSIDTERDDSFGHHSLPSLRSSCIYNTVVYICHAVVIMSPSHGGIVHHGYNTAMRARLESGRSLFRHSRAGGNDGQRRKTRAIARMTEADGFHMCREAGVGTMLTILLPL